MYKRLPANKKIELIKKIKKGEKVSVVCRNEGISRTIFYRWFASYEKASRRAKPLVLIPKNPTGKKHWRIIKDEKERKIIKTTLLNPSLTFKQIAFSCGVSTHGAWNVLKRHNLNNIELRNSYIYISGTSLIRERKVNEKWEMIKEFENGEKISKICHKFGVSRTVFYRWLKRYQSSGDKSVLFSMRPKGDRHWRYVEEAPDLVLEIVIKHPEFSPLKIAGEISKRMGKTVLGSHGVYNFLKKMKLNTIEMRISYAKSQVTLGRVATASESFMPSFTFDRFTSFIPPPFRNLDSILRNLIPLLIFSIGTLSIVAFLTRLLITANGFGNKIGIFFSFTALVFGMFFFLYSLKSYFAVSIVLSFSRHEKKDKKEKKPLMDSFLSLFGVEIIREKSNESSIKENKDSITDISNIKLQRMPFISIHLAMYNEKRVIERLLTAVTSIDYDNYEVIVADDSTDPQAIMALDKWKDNKKIKILHRDSRDGFKGQALQNALLHTDKRAEFIMVFDADFIPYPDSATQFLKYFQSVVGSLEVSALRKSNIAAVQGYQWHVLNKSENWITRGVRSEYAGSYIVERLAEELYGGFKQISGSVYMVRRDVVEKIGWGKSITEDFEFTLKLYNEGFKVVYTPYIQAPSEAVSTVKRIIRQRMRWAEGHSFNIKNFFWKLLENPKLNFIEKAEIIYLTPYYLQSAFFIIGTLSWFIAEFIFHVRLPFWTEVWGWSLIFTNMFALPLMNSVGLFLEESEQKDYMGLLSFVGLSYLVAPFQGYAAIKGFLEEKEGPWFRTPKTGKITDSFAPGHIYRYVKDFFGIKQALSMQSMKNNIGMNYYLALATSHNNFNKFSIVPVKKNKITGKAILALLLIATILLNYFSFFVTATYAAAPNPTIEQQINIIDQQITGSTTLTGGATGISYIDTSKYTGATYYFDVTADVTSGSGSVTLTYDAGTGSTPSGGSTVTISNISANVYTQYRSSSFTPTGGNVYISAVSGTGISLNSARVVIVQTSATNIQNTETQIEAGNNESTISTSDTPLSAPKYWQYTSSKYDGTVTAYFEADVVNSGANTTSVSLYPFGSSCTSGQALGTITGTGTTWQRLRSTSMTLTTGTTYMVCFSAAAGTASIADAKVIIDQNATSGISVLETYEQNINTKRSVNGVGNVQTFSTTNQGQLPAVLDRDAVAGATISSTNYVYVSGGSTTGAGSGDQYVVYKATINANGDIGTFSNTNQGTLLAKVEGHSMITAAIGGTTYIYVLGGYQGVNGLYTAQVSRATISSTGDVGTFSTTNQGQLPQALYEEYTAIATIGTNTYVYVFGGYNGTSGVTTVYKAQIDSSGNIGTFSTTNQTQLPVAEFAGATTQQTIGGTTYIYLLGGNGTNGSHVYKATLNSSGDVSSLTATGQTQLSPTETQPYVASFTMGTTSYIYLTGGLSNGGTNANTATYRSVLSSSGDVGSWSTTNQSALATGVFRGASYQLTLNNNYFYTLGGQTTNSTGTNVTTVNKAWVTNVYNSFGYNNLYESANWAGGTFTYYFESTLDGVGGTGYAELTPGALGTVNNTSTTTYSLVRSSSIIPVNNSSYDGEIQSANATNSWLVVDVSSLQTPENIIFFIPILLFLPKIVSEIKKRKELKHKINLFNIIKTKYIIYSGKKYRFNFFKRIKFKALRLKLKSQNYRI